MSAVVHLSQGELRRLPWAELAQLVFDLVSRSHRRTPADDRRMAQAHAELLRRQDARQLEPPVRAGTVYLLRCGDHYKIGRSRNPEQRRRQLQTAAAEPVVLVGTIAAADAPVRERALHHRYAAQRVSGERRERLRWHARW